MKQNLCSGRTYASIVLLFALQTTSAQTQSSKQKISENPKIEKAFFSPDRSTPSLVILKNNIDGYTQTNSGKLIGDVLTLRPGVDMAVKGKEVSSHARQVIEYTQVYKGIPVDRASVKLVSDKGKIKMMNASWYDIPVSLNITPSITKEAALRLAKNRINAKVYRTDELSNALKAITDNNIKSQIQKELISVDPGGQLVIIKDFESSAKADMHLAYKFNVYASQPLSRSWVYVDAHTGKILLVDAIIKHVNETPPGSISTTVQTRYAGQRNIRVKQISGNDPHSGLPLVASNPLELYIPGSLTYALIDDTRGNGVETYDLNGVGGLPLNIPALYIQGKSFTDADNNWTLGEHKRGGAVESENDDIAWDAHWGAGVVYDYWGSQHNRLSFDGNNGKIKSFIHSGLAFDNAFWNGEVMTYGDGSGTAANGFKPLTSLDVCAHEIGHGVCEFTANLVYAKESGAMNEGFSDIWAAATEYHTIKTIDPSMAAVLKPFYIGEQISADPANPLRRMDNPKAKGDPDTYNGAGWVSQTDCSPTLANDQCGVHTNSNVLNKWFYLLTVGSGAGSGPDAAYVGEDDGINDLGNAYSVTGQGFAVSEKVAYMTELLLSSTATYAEAREISIAVANELSGDPCSALVEAVTNAWYAVGVGPAFVKPCIIRYGFVIQPGLSATEASTPSGCISSKTYQLAVIMPAASSGTISVTGTAAAQDYSLASNQLSNTASTPQTKYVTVIIHNDGATEPDELVQLNLSLTNTGNNPVNNSFKLTILDDDVVPVIGSGLRTLLNETFTRANGFEDPAGWTETLEREEAAPDPLASGKNQWGIFDNKLAITGKEGLTGVEFPGGTYNSNSPSQTIIKSPLIDSRGLSLVNVSFDLTVQGELDVQSATTDLENIPVFDYVALAYSLDGVNFTEITTGNFKQFASALPSTATISGQLPASLANKQFYLGFRWFNDDNAGGPVSCSIDNLLVTGSPRTIENEGGHGARELLSAGQEVFFFSTQDGQVVSKLKNTSAKDYGCTNSYVERSGNASFNLFQNNQGLHRVSDKIIRVETSLSYKAGNVVTLYFTEAQLAALEFASGQSRTNFAVYHIQATGYQAAAQNNTRRYAATYTAIPGAGGSYSFAHSERLNGSYALGVITSLFLKGGENIYSSSEKTEISDISPNPVQSNGYLNISSLTEQRLYMTVVNEIRQQVLAKNIQVAKGNSRVEILTAGLRPGRYVVSLKNEKGIIIHTQVFTK